MTLLDASVCGWGKFSKGMVGSIARKTQDNKYGLLYSVDVPVVGQFLCVRSDFEMKEEKVNMNSSMTKFYEYHKERIAKQLKEQEVKQEKYDGMKDKDMTSTDIIRLMEAKKKIKIFKRALSCLVIPDTNIFKMVKSRLEHIRFDGQVMTFTTGEISVPFTVTTPDSKREIVQFPLGKYKVKCDFYSRSTYFAPACPNEDGSLNRNADSRWHPHLSNVSGSDFANPCWGNYGAHVGRAYRTLDISGLISICIDFLNHCYEGGWYTSILNFSHPEARKKLEQVGYEMCNECNNNVDDCRCNWCDSCDHHRDECSCDICGECSEHYDHCECMKCPDNQGLLENETFPDQYCGVCPHFTRDLDNNEWRCGYHGVDSPEYTTPLNTHTPKENNNTRYQTRNNGQIVLHANEVKRRQQQATITRFVSTGTSGSGTL